ncbi:hypothetical protein BLOT_005189 [Blomia tropicalis]|nr:hypothetical protein BLOT_005189 [Blomia tropicalis]
MFEWNHETYRSTLARINKIARYHRNDGTYTTTTASSLTTSANSQVIHERITTHVAGSYFSYSDCGMRDISKRLVDLERYPMTRIYFSKGFAFANERSAAEFDEQRSTFFRLNERYDHYLEIREGLDLVGVNFQEYMIAVGDRQYSPWYNNQTIFWLFSIAMLSWPIRILLEYNTANVNYQVVKLFGSNYQTMANGNEEELCPLSQTTTIDSLSNECLIAPSYSETMLAERIYCLRSCTEPIGDNEHFGNADDEDDEDEVDNLFIPIHNRQIKHKQSQTINGVHLPYLSRPVGKESDPPSYDEVIEDQRRTIHLNTNQRRTSFKTYWNQLISLVRNNLIMTQNTQMRRSITDKDFFQKYFYSNDRRKPWTSFGDISNNLITNV